MGKSAHMTLDITYGFPGSIPACFEKSEISYCFYLWSQVCHSNPKWSLDIELKTFPQLISISVCDFCSYLCSQGHKMDTGNDGQIRIGDIVILDSLEYVGGFCYHSPWHPSELSCLLWTVKSCVSVALVLFVWLVSERDAVSHKHWHVDPHSDPSSPPCYSTCT